MIRCHSARRPEASELDLLHPVAEVLGELAESLLRVGVHLAPARCLDEAEHGRDRRLLRGDLPIARPGSRSRVGIALVVADEHLEEQSEVADAPGEEPHVVEAARELEHAMAGDEAVGRLEAVDAAIRGGPDGGSAGLAAQRHRDHPRRHRRRRAARGAAGGVARIVRVSGLARRSRGELRRHRLAHDDAARSAEAGHRLGVARRGAAGVEHRAVLGRHVGGVDDVLDPYGYAVQGPDGPAGQALGVRGPRLREGMLGIEEGPGPDLVIDLPHARQAGLDELRRGDPTVPDEAGGVRRGQGVEVGGVTCRRGTPAARASCPAKCT